MSNQAMTWAFKQEIYPTGAKFVFVMLANYATQDGYCYASQERIASDTGQGVRTVRRLLGDLESAGWIMRERRSNKLGHRTADGFYLVGFSENLPAKMTSSPPAELAASQPAKVTARDTEPTGQNMQAYRPNTTPLIRNEPTIEPTIVEPPLSVQLGNGKKPGVPDPIWDALVGIHGYSPTPETPEHGRWNKAVGIWRKLHATPATVEQTYALYRREFANAPCTVSAVSGRAEHLMRDTSRHRSDEYEPPTLRGYRDDEVF